MENQYSEDSRNILYRYILFALCPIFAVVDAIINFRSKSTKTIITLYGFIWGLSIDYSDSVSDGSRYAERFYDFFDVNLSGFFHILGQYGEEGFNDFYTRISYFIVSRFTHSPSILFGVWGMVYFYFFASAILEIVKYADEKNIKILKHSPIFFLGFVFLMPLNAINMVRMWTAFMIFFTYAFKAIVESNKKYIFAAAFSILVHFSFIVPTLALIIFWNLKKNPIYIYLLVIITFITSSYTSAFLENYSEYFNDGLSVKMTGYSDEEYVERVQEQLSEQVWYAKYKLDFLKYYLFIVLLIPFYYYKYQDKKDVVQNLFLFSLILWALYNMTINVGSSERFFCMFAFATLAFLTLYGSRYPNLYYMKMFKYIGIMPIGLYVLITQVNALRFIDFYVAVGNIVTLPVYIWSL